MNGNGDLQIVREVTHEGKHAGWMIMCPGCGCGHLFDDRWTFNGDMKKPTFSASMSVNANDPASRCHSHVRDGQIQFLNDCWHLLKGKTVPLEPF
jgi:hypothetical protein